MFVQERKLRERLARRQQAKERGLSDEEINQMEEEEMAKEEEQLRRGNILLALKNNYDKVCWNCLVLTSSGL